jgi:hypothetical protein
VDYESVADRGVRTMPIYRFRAGLILLGFLVGNPVSANSETLQGAAQKMGQGSIRTYVELAANGKPIAIGLLFSAQLLAGLPARKNATSRCFDKNKDGRFVPDECEGDYELRLAMPDKAARRGDVPFKWVGFNWNPEGHVPPKIYDLPHFGSNRNMFITTTSASGRRSRRWETT